MGRLFIQKAYGLVMEKVTVNMLMYESIKLQEKNVLTSIVRLVFFFLYIFKNFKNKLWIFR